VASAAAAAAGDHYAELMAQFIRSHISTTGGPLNAPASTPARQCPIQVPPAHVEAQQATNLPPAANFPGGRLPAIASRIIGAYEGGAGLSCGVFHPAGSCIMRAPLATKTERGVTHEDPGAVHGFCHVCRYLIVDSVDPRRHFFINSFYHTYPQP
jgi:hypothetical protein